MICPNTQIEMKETDELKLQRNNTPNVRLWRSCCLEMNPQAVMFFCQYLIIVGLMVFFSVELHHSTSCEDKNLFLSLLTMCVGLIVPSPRLK